MSLPGKKAPAFTLPDQHGKKVKLADLAGHWVVLYFYPRDDTPGCTTEACDFTSALREFSALDAKVLGCSPDAADKHTKFIAKHGLRIDLLSDAEHTVMEKYGAYGEKTMYGKKVQGVIRSTFLIDPAGKVAHAWPRVSTKGHAAQVLAKLKELATQARGITTTLFAAFLALAASAHAQDTKPPATPLVPALPITPAPQDAPALYGFEVQRMDGKVTKLAEYQGKVLLLVNTASQCGLTPQYEGLEKLQKTYGDQGFTVLAFPANDFGQQEPGTNDEIAKFCEEKFAVTFPVFAKISVKGEGQAPLFKWLTTASPFPGDVQWNFQKYLVDRTGQLVARFDPRVKPGDAKVTAAIDAALAKAAPASATKPSTKVEKQGSATAGKDAIDAACRQAKAEDKVVFVHFSADWCVWCSHLEAFLARPEIAPIFDASFVHVRVDTERMADGEALRTAHAQGATGIPLMTWLEANGTIVARSTDDRGANIGYPSAPAEIAAFMQIFGKQAKHATPEQVALVRTTLQDLGEKPKAK